ncbi:helix-turn-helix domain-containing protein [Frateuria hangzhouensis]|uniref:helix-turn-helix domain-containing protein n=1 Tax=Frateuria hangzhouensis TaxID=2995589 RepID=UPI002260A144|nr:AraC family transcriptional regulator [Frateuria sp. STR12]MCX7513191.1 AraC family transcriptional regulator [Frateuria sp. STR12]
MSLADATVLFDSPLLRITGIDCRHPRGGCGCERGDERTHLALLRRGGFGYHLRGAVHVGDPATALLYRAGDSYRVSHPFGGGDACTCFEVAPEHEEECFGRRLRHGDAARALRTQEQYRHRMLHTALVRGQTEPLAAEEFAAVLCHDILHREGLPQATLSPAARRLARRAQEALLTDPAGNAGLATLATRVDCSPFHLARVFRRTFGLCLSDYRMRLRLARALDRLAEGADDLAALACDLGFAHHSHFGAAFRRHIGMTPAMARARLRLDGPQVSRHLIAVPCRDR